MTGQGAGPVPVIELEDVTRAYGEGELRATVLKGIDLRIYTGEFVAIMGPSGSGKSTLMNLLGCLDQPTNGLYRFAGRDVAGLSADERAALRRDAFGFIFQSYHLIPGMSARENVEIPALYSGTAPAARRERAEQLLTRLGLGDRMEHRPAQLSGGQQQRVSIARALMNGGQVIFADEPTGALDSHSGEEVMALLQELADQGHTVVLITHDPDVAAVASRQIRIADGEIVEDSGALMGGDNTINEPSRETGQGSGRGQWGAMMASALRSLRSHVFRTILTLLGIVIGVASVITMLAIGEGARKDVVDRISTMGSDLLLVRPGGPDQRGGRWSVTSLVPGDYQAIAEVDGVRAVAPELAGGQTLRYGNRDHAAEVNATSHAFPAVRQWPMAEGSFFTRDDEATYAAVAVLGRTAADALFPDRSPLGEYLMVNNTLFQVIGVMSERGASPMGQDQDDVVLVPYTTGSLRIFGQQHLRNITVAVSDSADMADVETRIHSLLLQRHGVEDFSIRNMAALIDTISDTQNTLTWLLGSIAAISLLVGGIGVMNIMLVNVTERTREIGIRMATGARASHILQQFLTEAWLVSALGGLIGVGLGLLAAAVIAMFGTPVHVTLAPMVLAFSCAFATGLVFGILPARKAANLDPVQALASE